MLIFFRDWLLKMRRWVNGHHKWFQISPFHDTLDRALRCGALQFVLSSLLFFTILKKTGQEIG